MVKLPNGRDYGIAIKFGRYDDDKLMDVLRYIEDNYEGVRWWGDDKPTEYTPDLTDRDDDYYKEELNDFALFIERDNELAWGSASDIYDEVREYDYIVYTAEEFVFGELEEVEIKNEMDVSFLYGD